MNTLKTKMIAVIAGVAAILSIAVVSTTANDGNTASAGWNTDDSCSVQIPYLRTFSGTASQTGFATPVSQSDAMSADWNRYLIQFAAEETQIGNSVCRDGDWVTSTE